MLHATLPFNSMTSHKKFRQGDRKRHNVALECNQNLNGLRTRVIEMSFAFNYHTDTLFYLARDGAVRVSSWEGEERKKDVVPNGHLSKCSPLIALTSANSGTVYRTALPRPPPGILVLNPAFLHGDLARSTCCLNDFRDALREVIDI